MPSPLTYVALSLPVGHHSSCPLDAQMDGGEYTQSTALLRYAGKLGGLYPDDALEALKVRVACKLKGSFGKTQRTV